MDSKNQCHKAAIMTWCYNNGRSNYGQILQCYAMQEIVKKLGYETIVIRYRERMPDEVSYQADMQTQGLDVDLYELCYRLERVEKRVNIRIFKFIQFIKENIHLSKQCYTKEDVERECSDAEVLFCGSDQIWNPLWFQDVYALNFGKSTQKRIAYAPSGVFFETPQTEPIYKKIGESLNKFQLITVREKVSVDILRKYTNRKIIDVVDPTILLGRDEWDRVAEKAVMEEEPYIFCYFLGRIRGQKIILKKIMKRYDVKKILFIAPIFHDDENDLESDIYFQSVKNAGPGEWLALIRDAKCVCTDSFHGMALSIVYRKQFYVMKRNILNTQSIASLQRQENLLKKVGIQGNRLVLCVKDIEKIEEIEYNNVYVEKWWKEIYELLKDALNIDKEIKNQEDD